jgi:hypothetical protein
MIEALQPIGQYETSNISSATKTATRIIMIMHLKGWYLKTSSIRQRVRRGIHWDEYQGEEEVGVRTRKNEY